MPRSNQSRSRNRNYNGNSCQNNQGNNNRRTEPLKLPSNIDLPFFAYGIFKPGQLAYSRIENYVKKSVPSNIHYRMLIRDGVPLIAEGEKEHFYSEGFLIYFKDDSKRKAYKTISNNQSDELYEWKEIYVGGNKANVLMGLDPEKGTSKYAGSIRDFRGEDDPFFREAMEIVAEGLDKKCPVMDIKCFLNLQKNYMLLWAIIERYASLKYNIGNNYVSIANEDIFKESLKRHVKRKDVVYNAENNKEFLLDANNPKYAIRYYYTFRCNVVHRGKASIDDEKRLRRAYKELYYIFKDVLDETFKDSGDVRDTYNNYE